MQRACDLCGELYEAKRASSRFHASKCRTAWAKGARPAAPLPSPPKTGDARPTPITDNLGAEFEKLGVAKSYEAATALGLARQLDSGIITGSAYVSLSKELDRRVDTLRLKAVRHDDPAAAVKLRLVQKQTGLA